MASLVKTVQTELLAVQTVASNTVVKSSAFSCSTNLAALIAVHFGRESATALTAPANIRVEASAISSGDGHWYPLAIFTTNIAACTTQAVNGTCNSGQNVVGIATTSGFSVGDIVFILNGTVANSEFHRVKVVTSNTSITLEDNLVNAQTGGNVYNAAQMFTALLDLTSVVRLRVVYDGSGTGQTTGIEAELTTGDSIG